jgi:hypothetical protein
MEKMVLMERMVLMARTAAMARTANVGTWVYRENRVSDYAGPLG